MQPVISGSADLGAGVGVAGVMRAFSKGAPVRILLPAFTGTGDLYLVREGGFAAQDGQGHHRQATRSPIRPAARARTISCLPSSDELGVKAKPTATGGPPGTLTSVMSGQIDIGWAAPPFGVKGAQGGQDPHPHPRQRRAFVARADGAHDHRQCRCVEDQEGRDPAVREGLSREPSTGCTPIRKRSRCMRRR